MEHLKKKKHNRIPGNEINKLTGITNEDTAFWLIIFLTFIFFIGWVWAI